jgi:ABC-type sugar transport system substrate-binding protein
MTGRTFPSRSHVSRGTTAIALGVAALLAAGCGSSDSGSSSTSAAAASTTGGSAGGDIAGKKVILSSCAASNPWCKTFNQMITEGLEAKGAKVTLLENNFDAALQVQQFNQAVQQKPDLILLEATDTKSMVPAINRAKQAGVPVINLDGRAEPAVEPQLASSVLADNEKLGEFAAQNIIEGLKEEGLDKANVAVITGTKASYITQDRMKGFDKVMATAPQYKVVEVEDGNWDAVKSGKIAQELFAKYANKGGIQAALGMADYQAVPIIQAAKQAGLKVGVKDKGLIVTGSNCTKAGIDAIKAGTLYGTATEDPVNQGKATADWAAKFLAGEQLPKTILVPQDRVTTANVAEHAAACSKS